MCNATIGIAIAQYSGAINPTYAYQSGNRPHEWLSWKNSTVGTNSVGTKKKVNINTFNLDVGRQFVGLTLHSVLYGF